ncbi:lipid-A-disaccharide synthase [Rhodobacter sp. KR11]|uniref:lipid-A-disaccharide synthase n=1 Tax=Rhodobacter sp. KR11 TaxID=2974588 RepID=UPI002222DE07|nr:lipid-A-disaccharide synthase [Rhodobacter sp. KR11]MCW1917726.1 lipid-A-disaccharide synthase [Rhodobacter sp. KR11]
MGALSFFLIAGEPSGDKLGAALMAGLKQLSPGVTFQGIGGPLMQAEGMTSLFPMEELSVMGLAEVLPKYFHLKRRIAQAAQACIAAKPAALITIDSPDFCLRVAAQVKPAGLRTIHYVAPSVWAWRPGRARKMAAHVDHVMALLPFEPPYMTAAGMTCDFVGHPVVAEPLASPADLATLPKQSPLVLCLPGSRRSEVLRLAPRFGETLTALSKSHPGLTAVLPTLTHLRPLVEEMTQDWPVQPLITTDPAQKRAAFAQADVALAASGTVSLELAANQCPMVIAYDLHPLTLWLMRRMALTDTFTLVNLVSDTRAIPEYIGEDFRPGPVAKALSQALGDPAAQQAAMRLTMHRLGQGAEPPGLRAARSVLAHL